MTIREATNQAIDRRDAKAAGKIVDTLRMGELKLKGVPVRFTYADCVAFFQRERPAFTADDFEQLMTEAEELETQDEAEKEMAELEEAESNEAGKL